MEFIASVDYCRVLTQRLQGAKKRDEQRFQQAIRRWDSIAKPLKGMGVLEEQIAGVVAINGGRIAKKAVAVFCADNGIVAEGVTQTGSEVTAIVAENMLKGEATVTNMAKVAGADVLVYDLGMIRNCSGIPCYKSAMGSENFLHGLAMSRQQGAFAVLSGIAIAEELKNKGYDLVASGEMGIGNTTTTSAVAAVVFGVDAHVVTGKGAGLTREGVSHKAEVINRAIALHRPDPHDPLDILSKVGGFDLAGLCGLFLGGMLFDLPILMDGFISSAAALLATLFCPEVKGFIFASHLSTETGAKMVMERLGFVPPLHCGMALGEGTGAVALMPLWEMAMAVYGNMPTFGDIEIDAYQPLS